MDEPRDDFLAGAGLAGDQDRRPRSGATRSAWESAVFHAGETATIATVPARGRELFRQRAHARLGARRALVRLGRAASLLGQPVVRERERDVVADPGRDEDVVGPERGVPAATRSGRCRTVLPSSLSGSRSIERLPDRGGELADALGERARLALDVVDDLVLPGLGREAALASRESARAGRAAARR